MHLHVCSCISNDISSEAARPTCKASIKCVCGLGKGGSANGRQNVSKLNIVF